MAEPVVCYNNERLYIADRMGSLWLSVPFGWRRGAAVALTLANDIPATTKPKLSDFQPMSNISLSIHGKIREISCGGAEDWPLMSNRDGELFVYKDDSSMEIICKNVSKHLSWNNNLYICCTGNSKRKKGVYFFPHCYLKTPGRWFCFSNSFPGGEIHQLAMCEKGVLYAVHGGNKKDGYQLSYCEKEGEWQPVLKENVENVVAAPEFLIVNTLNKKGMLVLERKNKGLKITEDKKYKGYKLQCWQIPFDRSAPIIRVLLDKSGKIYFLCKKEAKSGGFRRRAIVDYEGYLKKSTCGGIAGKTFKKVFPVSDEFHCLLSNNNELILAELKYPRNRNLFDVDYTRVKSLGYLSESKHCQGSFSPQSYEQEEEIY